MTVKEYLAKHPNTILITQEQMKATILNDLKKGERVMQINSAGKVKELSLNCKEVKEMENY